jgi:hypothetical protein
MSRLGGLEESFKVLKRGLGRSPSRKSILLNFVYFFALEQLVGTSDSRTATASVPDGQCWAVGPTWKFVRSGQGPTGHLVEIQMLQFTAAMAICPGAAGCAIGTASCHKCGCLQTCAADKADSGGLHSPDSI